MKVAVYTIALNEFANADRWARSAELADYRIVADTGSTDGTVDRLRAQGVTVYNIAVRPWRFDVARNTAMSLIPADADVCCIMDMDRAFEPGWREALERAWQPNMTAMTCRVIYRSSDSSPDILREFPAKNFHHRVGYRVKRAVHEAIEYTGNEIIGHCPEIVMCEVQDLGKETRRQYLPLMELAHKEDPYDAQICFWLGRELQWAGQTERAIEMMERYLALPSATWPAERAEAMRYLARLQPQKRIYWLERARTEAPSRREVWLDLAEALHDEQDWFNLFWACANGIGNTRRSNSYLDDSKSWGSRLYDLGAIAAWRVNAMDWAVQWGQKATELNPEDKRLQTNLSFFGAERTKKAEALIMKSR